MKLCKVKYRISRQRSPKDILGLMAERADQVEPGSIEELPPLVRAKVWRPLAHRYPRPNLPRRKPILAASFLRSVK